MSDRSYGVAMTAREIGVIQGLVAHNEAVRVAIREQPLDISDAFGPTRPSSRRAFVVTLYGAATDDYLHSPEPKQLLVISGPDIDGPVDVVALSPVKSADPELVP